MSNAKSIPSRLIAGLILAVFLDTAVQLLWKTAVVTVPSSENGLPISAVLSQPLFILVILLMGAQLLNWFRVLGQADLSYAKPITAVSFLSVLAMSAVFLKEHVTVLQLVGVGLVLAGVWFISQTDHVTVAESKEGPHI
ncbi:MAG: EamA family transporter [Rhodomicrobium sp.]